jgi:hypothetical protein
MRELHAQWFLCIRLPDLEGERDAHSARSANRVNDEMKKKQCDNL